jgi:lantibiotic biosynthesis protein
LDELEDLLPASTASWAPILEDDEARNALRIVKGVVRDLEAFQDERPDHSLGRGLAGRAVLFSYLAETVEPSELYLDRAYAFLAEALMLAGTSRTIGLGEGTVGVAWAVLHLRDRLSFGDAADSVAELDDFLLDQVGAWPASYDLLQGLVGMGIYALEGEANPRRQELAERVTRRLLEVATTTSDGVSWFTPVDGLPPWQSRQTPAGRYDLGTAHGIPGVINFLTLALSRGVRVGGLESRIRESMNWLFARIGGGGQPMFASFADAAGVASAHSHVYWGWCYGDLGVCAALLGPTRSVGSAQWAELLLARALDLARVVPGEVERNEHGLCHGVAGIAHLFNRLFHATGEATFAESSTRWFRRLCAEYKPDHGIGGFRTEVPLGDPGQPTGSMDVSSGLLEGSAGIALALLAAASPIEPTWDRCLLLSPAAVSPAVLSGA